MCNSPRESYVDYRTVVAQYDSVQVGFAIFYKSKNGKHVELFWLLVHPNRRREGIGSALIKYMRDVCREEFPHCEKIKLHVNERNGNAKGLYIKEGFHVKGTKHNYPEQGHTSHRMEMEIAEESDEDSEGEGSESSADSSPEPMETNATAEE